MEHTQYDRPFGQARKYDSAQQALEISSDISSQSATLTSIKLGGNTFGVEACRAIAAAMHTCGQMESAYLGDLFTGRLKTEIPPSLDAFVDALLGKSCLVHLDLSDNAFGPAGARPLQKLLVGNRNIQVLKLNNNGLGIEGGRLVAEALSEAHGLNAAQGSSDQLRVVVCGRNRLESAGATHLCAALALYQHSLTHVLVPQNAIRPDGIASLVASLGKCTKLHTLDLQDNTCTETGSLAIAKALASWPDLHTLHLGDCLLGAKGAVNILVALTPAHVHIVNLHLGFNEIKEDGARLVAAMLANKTQLRLIELNGNMFDRDCAPVQDIMAVLTLHGHLDALDELDEMEVESDEECESDLEAGLEDEASDEKVSALFDCLSLGSK